MAKKKRPTDINVLAKFIVDEAVKDKVPSKKEQPKEKNAFAVALGKLGGIKGGKARAQKLTAQQRKEIASKAARTRWRLKNKDD